MATNANSKPVGGSDERVLCTVCGITTETRHKKQHPALRHMMIPNPVLPDDAINDCLALHKRLKCERIPGGAEGGTYISAEQVMLARNYLGLQNDPRLNDASEAAYFGGRLPRITKADEVDFERRLKKDRRKWEKKRKEGGEDDNLDYSYNRIMEVGKRLGYNDDALDDMSSGAFNIIASHVTCKPLHATTVDDQIDYHRRLSNAWSEGRACCCGTTHPCGPDPATAALQEAAYAAARGAAQRNAEDE